MRAPHALALVLLAVLPALALPGPAAGAGSIAWHDFEEGMNLSLNQRKPAMVDFYTDWCTWCKEMDKKTYSDARVINRSEALVGIKVDGDARGDLVSKYKVDGYPTAVFLNPDGSEKHRVVGYKGPDDFLKDIDYVLGRAPEPVDKPGGICTFALLPLALLPGVVFLGRMRKQGRQAS
jgi:thiol:disulfide interchange protein DsbD